MQMSSYEAKSPTMAADAVSVAAHHTSGTVAAAFSGLVF